MPQLWTETMVSQYFWLITIFFILYIINATRIIPQIAFALKSRRFLGNQASFADSQDIAVNPTNSFLSSALSAPKGSVKSSADFSPLFDSASKVWAAKK